MVDNTNDTSNESGDSPLDALLGQVDLSVYSDEARIQVEALLNRGQAVEPGARSRFVAAANRAVRDRSRIMHAAIETLLFNARVASEQSVDKIAVIVQVDVETLRQIERGGDAKLKDLEADRVAEWARAVDLDREAVENGVRNSLSRATRTRAYASASSAELKRDDAEFLAQVLRRFDELAADS